MRLETSNPKTGKRAFVEKSGLLSKEHCAFIQKLSELRNHVVHNIGNFGFSLKAHIGRLDKKQHQNWISAIKCGIGTWAEPDKTAEENPRTAMLITTHDIMLRSFAVKALNEQMDEKNLLEKERLQLLEDRYRSE